VSESGYFNSVKPQTLHGLEARLTHFLEDLLEPMGRRERRHWARVYVQGLLLDGERKSIEPMASRIEPEKLSWALKLMNFDKQVRQS
jgi:SRSO17 transposase